MTGRKCSTCKHYDPAPIWRKGWCRNPLLYAPQQSHIVGEEDLDCERGMGNYWEAAGSPDLLPDGYAYGNAEFPLTLHGTGNRRSDVTSSGSGIPVYAVSGSSGFGVDPPSEPPPPVRSGAGGPPAGRERQLNYYDDERYWTDWLRIIAPIVGVILMVVLFYFWASSFLGGDDDTSGDVGKGQSTATLPVIGASPTTTARAGATGTPLIILTTGPTSTSPAGVGVTPASEPTATDEVPVDGGDIYAGATVRVANTGGTGANMRSDASTEAEVVAVVLDGAELVTTGEAIEGEGFVWWPVEGDAGAGYIVEDYLTLVE